VLASTIAPCPRDRDSGDFGLHKLQATTPLRAL
jgi:hypothetical protein